MDNRKYTYIIKVFNVFLYIQCLLNKTNAQETTASATTRPLDIDEASGDDSTTAESTTLEDLFSTSTPFSDSPTTNELANTAATSEASTSRIGEDTTVSTTDLPTTTDSTTNAEETTNARATTPLSDIGIDDDDTTTSAVTTSQFVETTGAVSTIALTTSSSTSTVSTTAGAQTTELRSVQGPSTVAPTTTVSSRSSDSNALSGCVDDRDCGSNQYCVSNNSTISECHCKPGYSVSANGLCIEKVKHFGGRMHFAIDGAIDAQRYREIASRLINAAFSSRPWFKDINLLSRTGTPSAVSYEIITEDEANIDSSRIESILEDFIETDGSYVEGCRCDQERCAVDDLILLASDTCEDAGQSDQVLCQDSVEISQYCDNSSTICTASDDGRISCPCRDGYVFNTHSSCIRLICGNDSDCNYGTCDEVTIGGMCLCQWGFDGDQCDNPWLLVTTVLLAFLLLVLLAAATYFCLRKKMKQRSAKMADMQEALSREPNYGYRKNNGHYHASAWHEGPVTPKLYKTIGNVTVHASTMPAAMALSPAQSTSVLTRSEPVIHPVTNDSVELQMNSSMRIEREPSRLAPSESEIFHIRNIARRKLSSRREPATVDSNVEFVLPNQAQRF